jgi:hypothetical protein
MEKNYRNAGEGRTKSQEISLVHTCMVKETDFYLLLGNNPQPLSSARVEKGGVKFQCLSSNRFICQNIKEGAQCTELTFREALACVCLRERENEQV